jgi:signal transduction histidine kinase
MGIRVLKKISLLKWWRNLSIQNKVLLPLAVVMAGGLGLLTVLSIEQFMRIVNDEAYSTAKSMIDQYSTLRRFYTRHVVSKIMTRTKLRIEADYRLRDDTIPLPAGMIHGLSEDLSADKNIKVKLNLYSPYPFPNRSSRQLDDFQKRAIDLIFFGGRPQYFETTSIGGESYARMVVPDRLTDSTCVNCHNHHPQSPRTGWKLHDIRGVLEISVPVQQMMDGNYDAMIRRLALLSVIFASILIFIYFILRRIRHDLNTANRIFSNIEAGNLENTIKSDSGDEIGRMLSSVTSMQASLLNARTRLNAFNAELEQRVLERTRLLETANKELEAFSYSVSHDLRAPLRHIDGYVDLLLNRFADRLPEKGRQYANTIASAARGMGILIDDLLQFAKTGRTELRVRNLDMRAIVNEVLQSLQGAIAGRKIEWQLGVLPAARGDAVLIRQVWFNLLENAVKYTRRQPETVIRVSGSAANGEVTYEVIDNGAGFDMRYAENLFGVFQRLHNPEEFEGTGIGLATVQRIISRHYGRVWATAEPGQGASFYFTLPVSEGGEYE